MFGDLDIINYDIDFHRALNEIVEKKINCSVFNIENLKDFDKAFDDYRGVKPEVLAQLSANSNACSIAPTVKRNLPFIYTDEDNHQFYKSFMVASN